MSCKSVADQGIDLVCSASPLDEAVRHRVTEERFLAFPESRAAIRGVQLRGVPATPRLRICRV
eukprot:8168623-Pyramimonas_sp.AAC.1